MVVRLEAEALAEAWEGGPVRAAARAPEVGGEGEAN